MKKNLIGKISSKFQKQLQRIFRYLCITLNFFIPFFSSVYSGRKFSPPINSVAANGHLEIVQLLMAMTNNPNVASNNGWTPIHSAAGGGYLEIVQILMTSTTNPNGAINDGRTPIFQAAACGHLEIVQLLMTSTTNPNIAANDGRTPIHEATYSGVLPDP